MPLLSTFAGIKIYMQFNDIGQHNKPHIHVIYGEHEAVIAVDGELLAGGLPRKQYRIVDGWLSLREEEVYEAWNKAVRNEHFKQVAPI